MTASVPDAVGPVVGWRYWRITNDGRLASLGGGREVWIPGQPFRARCRHARLDPFDERWRLVDGGAWTPHGAPEERCTCGLYAARDLTALRSRHLLGLRFMAAGEVSLWGKVIPARLGYRAELAYPRSIFIIRGHGDYHRERLGAYGAPVEVVSRRDVGFSVRLALTDLARRLELGAGA